MVFVHALFAYTLWHYTVALRQALTVWKNLIWYVAHVFSIGTLSRTLFSPWKRMQEEYGGGFDPEHFFEIVVANIMSRIVGVIIRLPIILTGIACTIFAVCCAALFYILWLLLPCIVLLLVVIGLGYIL